MNNLININYNVKVRSFKSKENIFKREVGPYRGFGYQSLSFRLSKKLGVQKTIIHERKIATEYVIVIRFTLKHYFLKMKCSSKAPLDRIGLCPS